MIEVTLEQLIQVREMLYLLEFAQKVDNSESDRIMIKIMRGIYADYLKYYKANRQQKRRQKLAAMPSYQVIAPNHRKAVGNVN
ncbi:MAG: hypothetical protein MUF87_07220 [Anaerolineae bacterium]|jgi:hypothetical protein|nr:hypothetical protein [Anaerolineae bacterium]